jgi:hypothetical protein
MKRDETRGIEQARRNKKYTQKFILKILKVQDHIGGVILDGRDTVHGETPVNVMGSRGTTPLIPYLGTGFE